MKATECYIISETTSITLGDSGHIILHEGLEINKTSADRNGLVALEMPGITITVHVSRLRLENLTKK